MKLHSIQSLRALAALLVMVYHVRAIELDAFVRNGLADTPLVSTLVRNGFAGVDLFFVISGFIMVYVTGQVKPRPMTSLAFLFARAARIYPLWWLMAAIMAFYFFVAYGVPYDVERTVGGSELMREYPWIHLLLSFGLLPQHAVPVYGLGWTLIHEMHFYLVFAALILLPRRWLPGLLGVWALAVTAGSLSGLSAPYPQDYLELAFHPLSIEFIAGCFAALLVSSGRRFRPALVLMTGVVIFLAGLYLVGTVGAFTMGWGRVLMFGLPSVLLVYGVASLEAEERLGTPKWLVTLGDWSYAIYLSHMIVMSGLRRLFTEVAIRLDPSSPLQNWLLIGSPGLQDNIFFYSVGISLALIASWLCFSFFEKPAMKLTGKWRKALFEETNAQLKPAPIKAPIW